MEAFSGILGTLGKIGGGIGTGVGAASPFLSVFGLIDQFSKAQKEKALMDRQIYYSKHPEAIANLAKGFERPLSTGLTTGVGNVVNASLAEQGLSQAPGIQSQVLAQALAPYQQNEQQMAITEALKAIGLPAEALQSLQSTMRPDALAMMLKSILPGQNPTSGVPMSPVPGSGTGDIFAPTSSDSGGIVAPAGDTGAF